MGDKKVSIVIPFYSHIEWLYEALESVFAQTYTNYEVIIVNDGSNEDMTDFLNKYSYRIKYIYQENSGPGAARNNGIRHASGDYIAFEDSDDLWLPTKLEKQVSFMEQSGAKWSHVGFYYWWPETDKKVMVNSSRDYDDIFLQRRITTKIATPAVIIDRSVYNEGQFYFPEEIRNGEDDRLWTTLAARYKIALVQEPLVCVRMRGDNSQTHAIERFNLRASNYMRWKGENDNLPFMIHFIYFFYTMYASFFGKKSTPIKEKIAKCFWSIPYTIERIYVRYLYKHISKDEKYIMRYR